MSAAGACIDGPGERTRLGYVRVWVDGRRVLAHRLSYETAHGPIPVGLELDHLCRNRWCRNPDHLEAVSHKENSRRSGRTRLTIEKAVDIRQRSTAGENMAKIAEEYGVTRQLVYRIKNGRCWT